MKLKNDFHKILKNKLIEQNMSHAELGRRISVTDTSISRYIYGDAKPRPYYLERIAKILNCPIEDFYDKEWFAKKT